VLVVSAADRMDSPAGQSFAVSQVAQVSSQLATPDATVDLPAGHIVQVLAPRPALPVKDPGGHGSQGTSDDRLQEPTGHGVQLLAPAPLRPVKEPVAHGWQPVPASGAYWPGEQASQLAVRFASMLPDPGPHSHVKLCPLAMHVAPPCPQSAVSQGLAGGVDAPRQITPCVALVHPVSCHFPSA
jgi:hypothetical protein